MEFPKRLKALRKEKKLTQTKLASKLHYGYTAIANYESGRNEPNIRDLTKLANILNVSIDYLVGNSDIKYAKQKEWYQNLYTKLKEYTITLTTSDYFLINMIYFYAKETATIQEYGTIAYDFFDNAILKCEKDFSDSFFLLLKNELYYNIVKNTITEELDKKHNE